MPESEVPAHAVTDVKEILVAAKRDAGPAAWAFPHAMLDRAARPIARLLVRLVDAAVDARLPQPAGICGDRLIEGPGGAAYALTCELPAGHTGYHADGDCSWGRAA